MTPDDSHAVDITCPTCQSVLHVPLEIEMTDTTVVLHATANGTIVSEIDTADAAVQAVGDVTVVTPPRL